MTWVMTESGWRHRPWWKRWVNRMLVALQPWNSRKWVVYSNCSVVSEFAEEPPEVLGYGFGRVLFLGPLERFEDVDPEARERALADPDLLRSVELACSILLETFPDAEMYLGFSPEMDEGATEDCWDLSVVACTRAEHRLERIRAATRKWARLQDPTVGHVALNAHLLDP